MADNLELNAGSGGGTIATDDISSVHYQKMLLGYGADGTWTRVTASAGFPIQLQTGHADIAITLDGEAVVLGAGSAAIGKLAANDGVDIGDVTINNTSIAVTGTFWQATQPVSLASVPSHAVTNAGTFAVQAAQSGTWSSRSQDGSGNALTSATRGSERALSVQIVDDSGSQITTFGGSGGTASTDDGAFTAGSGQGTPAMGFYSADTVDAGDVGVLAMDASRRLLVSIEADNVGIGGGTQYTEGDTDATITGTAMLMEGATNTLVAAQGTAADGLLVNLGTNNDVTVSGSVAVTGTFWQATQPISAAALPLPSGAATESTLSTASGTLTSIAGYLDTEVAALVTAAQLLDNCISGNEAQVDVVTSALPSGAATEASLSSIDGKITACNTGAVVISSGSCTVDCNSSNVTVDNTASDPAYVNIGSGGNAMAVVPAHADSVSNTANHLKFGSCLYVFNETSWDRLRGDATNGMLVNLGGNNDVTITSGTVTTVSAVTAITNALPAGDNNIGNVDVVTSALPTGAATEASLASIDGKVTACNTGAVVISSGTVTTVSSVTAIANALPAGDNNIGNVDIVTLPSGNLGQQAMAASLSVVPANNITDATYIGDIKFGEELPAGTNAIGKLAANSGVDIGDVDVLSIAAGTNTIGGVIGQQSSSILYDGTTACTVKRVSGVAAGGAPGTDALIGAVSGKKFRILALFLKATSATANNVYLATTTDTDVLGNSGNPIPLAVDADGDNDSGFVLPWNPGGWTETSTANEALNLHTSAAQDIVYAITYIEVA